MGATIPPKLGSRCIQVIRAAVLGSPISHSLSPRLHNAAFQFLEVEGSYEAIEVDEAGLVEFLASIEVENWTGFSLTMPLKEKVLQLAEILDPIALRIQSANTLLLTSEGRYATSTDYLAFKRILAAKEYSRVAVIGSGGTARAALGAIDGTIPEVDIFLRNRSQDEALQNCMLETQAHFLNFQDEISNYDLVISTTPKGVTDEIARRITKPVGELIEVLYSPWPTVLAERWLSSDLPVTDGIDLLVEQGLDQVKLFTKLDFDPNALRAHLLLALRT